MSLGVAGFIGVVIGGLVILILLIVCVICTCRRCGKKPGEAEHRPSIPSSTHGTVGAGQPQQQIIKDGITYQQVPQTSAGPTNPNIMQNPMNQYPQAGGLNRYPQNGGMNQYPQQPGYCVSLNQQQMPVVLSQVQRPGYLSQQPAMEMQLQAQPMMSCSGGPSAPSQTLPSGGAYMGGYNSPFHLARGPESHSYSSGYSSQQ
ncbi:hypothetical protein EB796_023324 [Bugula neritina]|uniref:Uncharacterized protein n=1 Tax=Bugula neritina TaxID=10212 RepID=A0A7J7IYU6_BUGNE|nr:hypothetical protein EB796_023324 [Bugula neritina]